MDKTVNKKPRTKLDPIPKKIKEIYDKQIIDYLAEGREELRGRPSTYSKDQTHKKCLKCGVVKPFSEFHKNPQLKDGHHSYCMLCRNNYKKAWNKNNKEKIRSYNMEYYKNLIKKDKEQGK